ncbi:MAG: toll/interleukin-1 receptor domain-containing protein [Polaromonas sp.]|nr:toll/interleukin-1 receptor domain-containing protein [Polaromonas sp.]
MTKKQIFLSHIHEESALAVLIKTAIESEFSGFVNVFVSSDGESIRAGAHFLDTIEEGLVNCVGAIYLISPASVKRPWISFELGAVWIRNAISQRSKKTLIPAIPFCHSGMGLSQLPPPIGSLNAIRCADPISLRRAFEAIQIAVGGNGQLRTNFDNLANHVRAFEETYTVANKLAEALAKTGEDINKLLERASQSAEDEIEFESKDQRNETLDIFEKLADGPLNGSLNVEKSVRAFVIDINDSYHGGKLKFRIKRHVLLQYRNEISSAYSARVNK